MSWALDQETFSSSALCTVVWRVIHGQKTDPWERSCMVTWRTEEDSGTSGRLKEMISEEEEEVYCVAKEKASGTLYKFTHDWLHVPRPTAHMTAYFCCGLGDDFMHHFQVHPWLFVVLHEMATGSVSKFTHDLSFVCCVAGDGFMHHVQVHTWPSFVCCVAGDGFMHHVQVHTWLSFVCCVAWDGYRQYAQVHTWLTFVCCVAEMATGTMFKFTHD